MALFAIVKEEKHNDIKHWGSEKDGSLMSARYKVAQEGCAGLLY